MLECERIDISDGIDVDMSDKSKRMYALSLLVFFNKNFSYRPYLCDGAEQKNTMKMIKKD